LFFVQVTTYDFGFMDNSITTSLKLPNLLKMVSHFFWQFWQIFQDLSEMWRWMCCLWQRFVICSFCFRAVKRQFTKEKNENLWQLKTIKNIYFHIIFSLNVMKWTKYYIYCFYLFTSAHLSLQHEYLFLSSPWKDVLTYLNKKQLKNKHILDSFFLECHKIYTDLLFRLIPFILFVNLCLLIGKAKCPFFFILLYR
jgi:hypothetical protein